MSGADNTLIAIAVSAMKGNIPEDLPLAERLAFAMRYVRAEKNQNNLFFMVAHASDDLQFRTALAFSLLHSSEEEKEAMNKSLKALASVNALMSGVPVDVESVDMDGVLPLMKLWHESEKVLAG